MKVCINTTNVMSRVIYTPQIGFACTQFSRAYETHFMACNTHAPLPPKLFSWGKFEVFTKCQLSELFKVT